MALLLSSRLGRPEAECWTHPAALRLQQGEGPVRSVEMHPQRDPFGVAEPELHRGEVVPVEGGRDCPGDRIRETFVDRRAFTALDVPRYLERAEALAGRLKAPIAN